MVLWSAKWILYTAVLCSLGVCFSSMHFSSALTGLHRQLH